MKTTRKTIAQFEQTHAQPRIKTLQRQVEAERAKVEALAGVQNKVVIETSKDSLLRYGIIGDTHIGSLYHMGENMSAFYQYAHAEGFDTIYHTGDVLSGHRVFRGHEFELRDIGGDAQVMRLVKDAPKIKGMTTKFITGNHDASLKILAGMNVGKQIQLERPDWVFLGEEQAQVQFATPNGPYSLRLVHPGGGSAYALSYKIQKQIESLSGGNKPDMLALGHFHKAEMLPSYRNVCGIQSGTFESQTPFMARQSLAAHVGGWLIEVRVGDGLNTVKAEFVAFYV